MTDEQAAIVDFLRHRYAGDLHLAQDISQALTAEAGGHLGIPEGAVAAQTRRTIHAAETRARFLEETVVAYLGTAGPTGRIADQQLRLLAWEHNGLRGYRQEWRP